MSQEEGKEKLIEEALAYLKDTFSAYSGDKKIEISPKLMELKEFNDKLLEELEVDEGEFEEIKKWLQDEATSVIRFEKTQMTKQLIDLIHDNIKNLTRLYIHKITHDEFSYMVKKFSSETFRQLYVHVHDFSRKNTVTDEEFYISNKCPFALMFYGCNKYDEELQSVADSYLKDRMAAELRSAAFLLKNVKNGGVLLWPITFDSRDYEAAKVDYEKYGELVKESPLCKEYVVQRQCSSQGGFSMSGLTSSTHIWNVILSTKNYDFTDSN